MKIEFEEATLTFIVQTHLLKIGEALSGSGRGDFAGWKELAS